MAYFPPNGLAWQYAGTVNAATGWTPGVVKGTIDGFVVAGQTATGQIVAYTSTGDGTTWRPTGSLGPAARESVTSVTLTPGGTVVAVGSADGRPAVWQSAPGGGWRLVSSLSVVSAYPGLSALTSVTYGPFGWLAVGVPGPVVLTSANGKTWHRAGGGIEKDLGGVSAVATAAGPAGYAVVGRPAGPDRASVADVWWSQSLTSWTRAQDMNVMRGSIQVLAVAADSHGFVSAGSHDNQPVVWTTSDGGPGPGDQGGQRRAVRRTIL